MPALRLAAPVAPKLRTTMLSSTFRVCVFSVVVVPFTVKSPVTVRLFGSVIDATLTQFVPLYCSKSPVPGVAAETSERVSSVALLTAVKSSLIH